MFLLTDTETNKSSFLNLKSLSRIRKQLCYRPPCSGEPAPELSLAACQLSEGLRDSGLLPVAKCNRQFLVLLLTLEGSRPAGGAVLL